MNDKQKKILLILGGIMIFLIIILVVIVISSRSRQTQSGDSTEDTHIKDGIELSYWGLWEPLGVMQPIIDQYESLNPGVKIRYSQQDFDNYETRLYTRLAQADFSTEPAPDIARINNTWTPKFYRHLSPLPSSVMNRETYIQTFYPTAINDFTAKDGNIYALPWEIDGLAIFYNKAILREAGHEEPPRDWDSFIELAKELTIRNEMGQITRSGLAIGTAENIFHSADILSFMMLLNGADIIDETYTVTNLTSSEVTSAMEVYVQLAQGDDAVWASYLKSDLEFFFEGNLAMIFGPSWRAFDIIEAASHIEFGIAPLPQLSNDNPVYYSMYWGDTVSAACEHPEVAWDFISFLVDKQEEIFSNSGADRAFGEPYSLVSLNDAKKNNPYLKAYAEMAPYMQSWGMGEQTLVEEMLNDAITQISQDDRALESVMRNTQKDINDQLAESNK